MHWFKTDKDEPCNIVKIKGSKVFDCAPGWEVAEVYYDELDLDVDSITVRFTRTRGKEMGKKYIIELEDKVSENAKGEKLYFVKGFNNLSLDETALKKLTPYNEPEHELVVGDVVELDEKTGIITSFNGPDTAGVLFKDGCVRWVYTKSLKYLNKNFSKSLHVLLEDFR